MPGLIGNGARFDGHSLVRIAARPGLAVTDHGLTFSAWVQLDADSPRAVLYSQSQNGARIEIGVASARLYAEIASGPRTRRISRAARCLRTSGIT